MDSWRRGNIHQCLYGYRANSSEIFFRKWEIFIDKRIVEIAQELRNVFGAITINDKSIGGSYNLSGWRPFDCKIGAKHSSHKFGRGLDLKFNTKGVDPILVQDYILKNQGPRQKVQVIEDGARTLLRKN